MAERIRDHDWTSTALGPIERWPLHLKTAVDIMLTSPSPVSLIWGPERVQIYNDAYIPVAAERHPAALGQTAARTWSEAYDQFLRPVLDRVFAGETVAIDEHAVQLRTSDGNVEERFFTGTFQPVHGPTGKVDGAFHPLTEVTEQVRAGAELREGDQRLHRVMDGMAEGFSLLDRNFRLLEINAEGLRLAGQPREETIGKTLWQAWRSSDDSELGRCLERAMAERAPAHLHHRHVSADGGGAWLEVRAYPTDDGLALFWRDVTERVRADRRRDALLTLDDRLRDIANPADLSFAASKLLGEALGAVRVGYGVLDPLACTIAVQRNWSAPGFADVAGVHKFSDYGTYIDELLRGDAVANSDIGTDPRTAANADSFRALGVGAHLDVPVIENGQAVAQMFVHSARPRVWSDEDVRLVREFAERTRTAIARRTAEAALRQSEKRYRTLFETIDEGFCVLEFVDGPHGPLSDYVHVEANPAYTANAGIPDIVGKRLREVVLPEESDSWVERFRSVLVTGEPIRFDQELAATGRHLELAAFRVGTAEQRQVAVLFQDVSGRKRAERDLRELNDTLESRIAERTAELVEAQEALRQSRKLEAMGQLTGGVAHDFNNLLTPIIGSLDLLMRRGIGSERERRLIDGALQSAERAKTLVQRLLAFARRQPLQPGPVDLKRLIGGMADLIDSTTGPKIDVRVDLPDDLPPAVADANQLEMAVLNLAVNARDAMPDGGVLAISAERRSVRAGSRSELRHGHYVRLAVADTGVGMAPETLARAVEPFFSTKGVGKGTGLGLSMVHGLAAQLGGELTIDSAPGQGTSVALWLPVSAVAINDDERAPEIVLKAGSAGTALLVDDEDLVRMSTADMLTDLGYQVTEAGSAEEALRLVGDGLQPDLLVTDHLMPGMSGAELARSLRARRPDLPVLVVSGYAEVQGVEPGLARLTKPFRNAELAASLLALVAGEA